MTKEGCDIWTGTQVPGLTQAAVMKLTGLQREQVRIHNHLLGGGFGRRLEFDGTVRAVQIAQHVSGPVQVIWTREEDIQHDLYRPYYYDRISAGLDAQGKAGGMVAPDRRLLDRRALHPGMDEGRHRSGRRRNVGEPALRRGRTSMSTTSRQEPPGIRTTWWRGVGVTRGTFVVESFIDELAGAGAAGSARLPARFARQATRAPGPFCSSLRNARGGARRCRPGRGAASRCARASAVSSRRSCRSASDKDGAVSPTHAWCAVDCGLQVNPDTIRAQMESGIIFGLSAALFGEITIKDGRVEQTNFGDYRVLRISEAPRIEVDLVNSTAAPGGIGEPGTSCVMPALTNAIFAATGRRIRKLPVGDQTRPA